MNRINNIIEISKKHLDDVLDKGLLDRINKKDYTIALNDGQNVYVLIDHVVKIDDCKNDYELYCEMGKELYKDINLDCNTTYIN